jgi:hypothetical protein
MHGESIDSRLNKGPFTTNNMSTTGANMSSMMQQEMKAIQKIKEKQKKEIEQMIEMEVKMNQIKSKNELNIKMQQ